MRNKRKRKKNYREMWPYALTYTSSLLTCIMLATLPWTWLIVTGWVLGASGVVISSYLFSRTEEWNRNKINRLEDKIVRLSKRTDLDDEYFRFYYKKPMLPKVEDIHEVRTDENGKLIAVKGKVWHRHEDCN